MSEITIPHIVKRPGQCMAFLTGIYINLDSAKDRRRGMEAQLAVEGFEGYTRLRALTPMDVQARSGLTHAEAACYESHLAALRLGMTSQLPLHVMEDDVLLSAHTPAAIKAALDVGFLDNFDVVLTGIGLGPSVDLQLMVKLQKMASQCSIQIEGGQLIARTACINLEHVPWICMASYIVRPQSIKRVHDLLSAELNGQDPGPCDLMLKRLCDKGQLRVGCVLPFLNGVRLAVSNPSCIHVLPEQRDRILEMGNLFSEPAGSTQKPLQEARSKALYTLPFDLYRNFLYFDVNWHEMNAVMDQAFPKRPQLPQDLATARLIDFLLSGHWPPSDAAG